VKCLRHLAIGLLLLAGTPVLPLHTITWLTPAPTPTPAPAPTPVSPSTVTAIVYVYEKDDGPVPAPVASALDRINREKKVPATMFEDDTVDGTGQTPEQYRVPVQAGRASGLPTLVVMSGTTVAKTVKAPKTADDVLRVFP
jgi:hypothetical protein